MTDTADSQPLLPAEAEASAAMLNLIQSVEELRLAFNEMASARNTALVDLIVARLSNDNVFMAKLAEAIYQQVQRAKAPPPAPVEVPQMTLREVGSATAGFYPFEGYQFEGRVEVDPETDEVVRAFQKTSEDGDERPFNTEDIIDNTAFKAIKDNYAYKKKNDEPFDHGLNFWYTVEIKEPST